MLRQVAASVLFGLALTAGGTASADGMPGSVKDAPVLAPSWSAFYIGAGVGYGLLAAENKYWEPQPAVFSSTWKGEGGQGGFGTAVIGFDRQIRERYVLGAFVEYDWSSLELTYEDTDTPQQKFRMDGAFSVGGRAGFLLTPTSLLYVTGGYTWARGKADQYFDIVSDSGQTFYGATSLDLNGPFVGIGMETLIGQRLSLRAEGRYTMFDEVTTNQFNTAPNIFRDTMTADVLTARLAVTYRFTRDEPHTHLK
jgi:outer membrane immunogenic protein